MPTSSELIEAGKYVVEPHEGLWRLSCGAAEVAVFTSRAAATELACGMASGQARAGSVGIVVVQDEVRELHCFTPGEPQLRPANDLSIAATGGVV